MKTRIYEGKEKRFMPEQENSICFFNICYMNSKFIWIEHLKIYKYGRSIRCTQTDSQSSRNITIQITIVSSSPFV